MGTNDTTALSSVIGQSVLAAPEMQKANK